MSATSQTLHADYLILSPGDDVAVAVRRIESGKVLQTAAGRITAQAAVPPGHKIALRAKPVGERIHKYGHVIGVATRALAPGDWVHSHNLSVPAEARSLFAGTPDHAHVSSQTAFTPAELAELRAATFAGYRRADGRAGTRNYIAVISSVNCSASVSRYITQRFPANELRKFPHIDGLLPLTHKGGCGLQYGGEAHDQLARVLAGFARHPNIAGFLLVGLGCETGTLSYIIDRGGLQQSGRNGDPQVLSLRNWNETQRGQPKNVPVMLSIQDCGGTQKTVEAGIAALAKMLPPANDVRREPIPAAELILGLECGGSDAWSGITANPALGIASDLLVAAGGTAVLSETPEIYGAEHLLAARAVSPQVIEKLNERVRWWEEHTHKLGVSLDNNPSPGNKEGGLTTIYEKSLGAVAKGGSSPLVDVYRYAELITQRGFVFMDSPGYDPASITGMVASGANVVCFTTGRGSCFGCKPTPSIKIATNTAMFQRMRDDMDINAGVAVEGTPLANVGAEIFRMVLDVASGRKTKSEEQGLGEEEFAPWDLGPTL